MNKYDRYLDFASKVSFFEFIQPEFKEIAFDVGDYSKELRLLSRRTDWNVRDLTKFLREHPKAFEVFEQVFQLRRFTNTQLIHFMFDISILNSSDLNQILDYLIHNIKYDPIFADLFLEAVQKNDFNNQIFESTEDVLKFIKSDLDLRSKNFLVLMFKSTVIRYIESIVKDGSIAHDRISNPHFKDVSKRFAKYLIYNLSLNEVLKGIRIKDYLRNKRIPIDTKSIHGNFGKIKISEILERHGFINGDPLFKKVNLNTLDFNMKDIAELKPLRNKYVYLTEKYVEGVLKRTDKRHKKFDFVLLHDLRPLVVIETNFYSTSGTKIGINENEYINLDKDIKSLHRKLTFLWITDGNYWLSSDGIHRYLNLYGYFGDRILNYALFDQKLERIKENMLK